MSKKKKNTYKKKASPNKKASPKVKKQTESTSVVPLNETTKKGKSNQNQNQKTTFKELKEQLNSKVPDKPTYKRKPGEYFVMPASNKRSIWFVFITVFVLVLVGQMTFTNVKYNSMVNGLEKDGVKIVTNVQNGWVFEGKDMTKWGDKPFGIRENNYKTENDLLDKLNASKKNGSYSIMDNTNNTLFVLKDYHVLPKTVISKILNFEEGKTYDLKQVMKESKTTILLAISIILFGTLLMKSFVLLLAGLFIGKVYSKIRKKDLLFKTIFYIGLNGLAYGTFFQFGISLLFTLPIDISMVVMIIVIYLFVETQDKVTKKANKEKKVENDFNQEKENEELKKDKNRDTLTEPLEVDETVLSFNVTTDGETVEDVLEVHTEPLKEIKVAIKDEQNQHQKEMLEKAQEIMAYINTLTENGEEIPFEEFKEKEIGIEDLPELYIAYQNREEFKTANEFEDVNRLYAIFAEQNMLEKEREKELSMTENEK